ncbi:MAG: hypothetical protein D6675_15210 [Gemmatimonadetes bacterium]|nr:MAG: hypothetical protein D6675_15210 [Gemmatimonadota bacterium]
MATVLSTLQNLVNPATVNPAVWGFFLGIIFAWVDLARKYPTTQRYLAGFFSAYFYVFVSACGAAGVTYALAALGISFGNDLFLNKSLQSLLGAGLFIGVISTVAVPTVSQGENTPQLKTLRDFIYDYLNTSINRKLTQRIDREIKKLHNNIIDKERFQNEAEFILQGIHDLTQEEKKKLSMDFTLWGNSGRYSLIIRELVQYRDLDFIIQQLSDENIISQDTWIGEPDDTPEKSKLLEDVQLAVHQFIRKDPSFDRDIYYDIFGMVYNRLGEYAQHQHKPEIAQQYFKHAFYLAERVRKTAKQAEYSYNLGQLALTQKDWGDASKWYIKTISLAAEDTTLSHLMAGANLGLARVYQAEQRPELARKLAEDALKIYRQTNDTNGEQAVHTLLEELKQPPHTAA